ncbi:MAG: FtsX-like permease family protein [Chitinophagaceae bacterium]|nr:FtsX-like permease family protein [Chitinophagaceae bacterium]
MIKNYFKIAWRNIQRNKMSSFIHISGLSIGIACALMIVIFIQHELSYDKFHKDAGRIFQVTLNGMNDGQEYWAGNTPPPVGSALARNIPEIESFARFYKPNDIVVRYESNSQSQKSFTEKNVLAVDSNFLQLFDFKVLEGDVSTALLRPGSVVLTEDMATKYFGNERPVLGRTLLLNHDKKPFTVTAVLKNVPAESSIQFDFLAPVADFPVVKRFSWSWVWLQTMCYVKLREGVRTDRVSIQQLEAKFRPVIKVESVSGLKRLGTSYDEIIKKTGKWDFRLFPLTGIHLRSGIIGMPWLSKISDIKYVYIFASVALFIIILACVNFMNLSTARSSKRAKEVGIRKVAGSSRGQLIRQFLAEAFLFTIISSIIAVALVILLLKPFANITGETINPNNAFTPAVLFAIIGLIIIIGFLAGSYPAFYLTSFKPAAVLKGKNLFSSGKKSLLIRNGLVVFQFTISSIIIISTLIVWKQLKFFRNADMGLNKENVLVITSTNRLGKSEESFRETISQLPGVSNASISTSIPTGSLFGDGYEPKAENNEHIAREIALSSFMVDEAFVPTLKIKVLKGRNFSKAFSDSASVVLNEEAAKQIGWKDPVGKWIQYPGNNNQLFQVIGVVKNFNVQSLQNSMIPFALFHTSSRTYDIGVSHILARIRPGNINNTISQLESKWKSFAPGEPFDYNFLDAEFDSQYRSEQRLGKLFSVFAGLSIFIACLGLFGLCAFVAERRTKEIGIRKVLGASVQSLVSLLSKDFLKLTIAAALISFPVAWWAMHKWLEDFAYRINIGWTVFVIAGLSILLIALATISFQAIKAAVANPVKSLRTE